MSRPDKQYRIYADTNNVHIFDEMIAPPDDTYHDTLKFSNVNGALVERCKIIGTGPEDAVDLMRYSRDIVIRNCTLLAQGKYCITIKGGCKNIILENVIIENRGSETEIDLGNRSHFIDEITDGIILRNVTASDGKPVRVRVLNAKPPIVEGGNVKVTVYPKWLVKVIFFVLKLLD